MKKMLAVAGAVVFAGLATLAQTATNVAPTALKVVETTPEAAQTGAVAKTVEATSDWLVSFTNFVEMVDGWVWGVPLIAAILVTGLLLTCILRFTHLFNLKRAFQYMFHQEVDPGVNGEVSQFGALCTALSATIGTGNIVGVATAIGTGGPGALFWMEVAAFFGMATKYAEGLLAVKYREVAPDGRVLGGPFYYIEKGLGRKWKPLAVAFAVFGALAGIMGIGTITQIHGITSAVQRFFDPNFNPADMATGLQLFGTTYSVPVVVAGLIVTACVGLVVIGGLQRIAKVSTVIVPFMAIFYVVIIAFLLLGNLSKVTAALELIVRAAFNPSAFTGGMVGTIFIAMQKGIARGIFSNEAGLGSAPIAAAAAQTKEPVRQGLVSMTGTFLDTIVVCSMTGLALTMTNQPISAESFKGVSELYSASAASGAAATMKAFAVGIPFLPPIVTDALLMVSLVLFGFTTILGWDYYSERCLEYLTNGRMGPVLVYRWFYIAAVFIGPYMTISAVWGIADIVNGLMAVPNMIALLALSGVIVAETKSYFRRLKAGEIKE